MVVGEGEAHCRGQGADCAAEGAPMPSALYSPAHMAHNFAVWPSMPSCIAVVLTSKSSGSTHFATGVVSSHGSSPRCVEPCGSPQEGASRSH